MIALGCRGRFFFEFDEWMKFFMERQKFSFCWKCIRLFPFAFHQKWEQINLNSWKQNCAFESSLLWWLLSKQIVVVHTTNTENGIEICHKAGIDFPMVFLKKYWGTVLVKTLTWIACNRQKGFCIQTFDLTVLGIWYVCYATISRNFGNNFCLRYYKSNKKVISQKLLNFDKYVSCYILACLRNASVMHKSE